MSNLNVHTFDYQENEGVLGLHQKTIWRVEKGELKIAFEKKQINAKNKNDLKFTFALISK